MKIKVTWQHSALLLSCCAIAGLISWFGFHTTGTEAESQQYEWYPVHYASISNSLGLAGHFEAMDKVTLSAPFDGSISQVNAEAGSRVRGGDVIFTMNSTQIDMRIRTALSDLLKARKDLSRLELWNKTPEIARLRRQVSSAAALLKNSEVNLSETRALYEKGIVARNEVDAIRLQVQTQSEELQNARDDLTFAQSEADSDNRKIAQMALANAQAQYDTLTAMARHTQIRAPFDGLLVAATVPGASKAQNPQPGQQVQQGTPIYSITGLTRFQVKARIQESDVRFLKEGMDVIIRSEGLPGESLKGRLTLINVQNVDNGDVGGGAEYDVTVSLLPSTANLSNLRLGMSAALEIVTYANPYGLAIPPQAIQTDTEGKSYVNYRRDANAMPEQVFIKTGRSVASGIEVSNLDPGEVMLPH